MYRFRRASPRRLAPLLRTRDTGRRRLVAVYRIQDIGYASETSCYLTLPSLERTVRAFLVFRLRAYEGDDSIAFCAGSRNRGQIGHLAYLSVAKVNKG